MSGRAVRGGVRGRRWGGGGAGTRHKYIGAMSGSLVGLVSKTNIFLY